MIVCHCGLGEFDLEPGVCHVRPPGLGVVDMIVFPQNDAVVLEEPFRSVAGQVGVLSGQECLPGPLGASQYALQGRWTRGYVETVTQALVQLAENETDARK